MNKIILVDADGVLLNWEYAFCCWMEQHGYEQIENGNHEYDIAKRFSITKEQAKAKVKIFNESAAIAFLPALRDAMFYVKRLHEEHGYEFHCITDKDEALAEYKDSDLYWVEDKMENAIAGQRVGLKSILMEHGFNMNDEVPEGIYKALNWKDIYEHITGEKV
jgi:predicted ATP-dependent endonuclease of OLD family